jgi:hypothetical protein
MQRLSTEKESKIKMMWILISKSHLMRYKEERMKLSIKKEFIHLILLMSLED